MEYSARICIVNIYLVINTSPGAPGICGNADIVFTFIGNLIAGTAATGLIYKTGFRTYNFTMGVLVFYSSKEPV